MFHIETKNIVSATSKFCNFHQIEPTHGRDAVCVSGTEPNKMCAVRYLVRTAHWILSCCPDEEMTAQMEKMCVVRMN